MPETVDKCPLCHSERSALFDRRDFRGHAVVNRLCSTCGLVYQSPRMTEAERAAFYVDEYRLLNEGSTDPTARNMAVQSLRADELFRFVEPVIQRLSSHLDIGCSSGLLLERFKEAYHCRLAGIEPGEAHRARACEKGLQVFASLEELEGQTDVKFDLVSMSHVLEHLPDPVGYLTHLRQTRLDPSGWILLEVPNLYAHDSFEVAHLTAFSAHTLRETLRKSGFAIVKFEEHGRPSSGLFPLFLTVLCRPDSIIVNSTMAIHPEKWVTIKRRTGMLYRYFMQRIFPKRAWLKID
jgi:2-polyprenyl-3-methyl-5-hydroxy-6-metoxy-1,4-benzoquinol methylase